MPIVERNGLYWDGDYALLDWDEATKTVTWIRFDPDGGLTIRTDQHDVEDVIEPNHAFAAATEGKRFGDWVRIASVPNIIAEQNHLDVRDDKHLSRWLNDSANRKFRTSRGKF